MCGKTFTLTKNMVKSVFQNRLTEYGVAVWINWAGEKKSICKKSSFDQNLIYIWLS